MPYHRVVVALPNGLTEEFGARISPRGVAEWLNDREGLRIAGFPDRPPDVDTPKLRLWAMRPGEEHFPYFVSEVEFQGRGWFAILSMDWTAPDTGESARLHLAGWKDGSFTLSVAFEPQRAGLDTDYPATADPDRVWADIEKQIVKLDVLWGVEPRVVWPSEFEEAEFDLSVAKAEFARGFLSPLGEARA
jgi:hypothetical protein